jgi:hypothetical protein
MRFGKDSNALSLLFAEIKQKENNSYKTKCMAYLNK